MITLSYFDQISLTEVMIRNQNSDNPWLKTANRNQSKPVVLICGSRGKWSNLGQLRKKLIKYFFQEKRNFLSQAKNLKVYS